MTEAIAPGGKQGLAQRTVRLKRSTGRIINALILNKKKPLVDALVKELTKTKADLAKAKAAYDTAVLAFGSESMERTKAEGLLELERTCGQLQEKRLQKLTAEKKLLEKLLDPEFVAQMVHELRTPLTIIMGFAEVLKLPDIDISDSRVQDMLGKIENAGHRMKETVDMLLYFYQAKAEKLKATREKVDVGAEMATIIGFMQSTADGRKVTLVLDNQPKPVYAELDPRLLHHVMVNLIYNGIRYNRKDGTGNVTVAVKKKDGRAEINVSDTGIGIKKEDIPRLFNAFERLDSTKDMEGIGLGLAVVKTFTEKMGGTVSVESEPGKGSTFTVSFPAAKD